MLFLDEFNPCCPSFAHSLSNNLQAFAKRGIIAPTSRPSRLQIRIRSAQCTTTPTLPESLISLCTCATDWAGETGLLTKERAKMLNSEWQSHRRKWGKKQDFPWFFYQRRLKLAQGEEEDRMWWGGRRRTQLPCCCWLPPPVSSAASCSMTWRSQELLCYMKEGISGIPLDVHALWLSPPATVFAAYHLHPKDCAKGWSLLGLVHTMSIDLPWHA